MIASKLSKAIGISVNANVKVGTAALQKRWQMTQHQAHYPGTPGRADLHMHSTYSDGIGTIQQILHHVEYNPDLDVIAPTDHDVIEGA